MSSAWRCKKCDGIWFRKENQMKLDRSYSASTESEDIPILNRPGTKSYRMAYICVNCNTELKEPYKNAR